MIKNDSISEIIDDNQIINLNYIINNENNNNSKINIDINYLLNGKKVDKSAEIYSLQLPDGEELSKLIVNNYLNYSDLNNEEKTKMALKYHVLTKNTSLFAEIELSDKITKEMNEEIIGNKPKEKPMFKAQSTTNQMMQEQMMNNQMMQNPMMNNQMMQNPMMNNQMNPMMNNQMNPMINNQMMQNPMMNNQMMQEQMMNSQMMMNPMMNIMNMTNDMMANQMDLTKKFEDKNNNEIKKIDLKQKDDIMKIINSQDFIDGFWEINEITEIIKEKYIKECFIKDKNIPRYWNEINKLYQVQFNKEINLDPQFKDLFLKMVAYNPDERLTIGEIFNHPYMAEVFHANQEQLFLYENNFIEELNKIDL